MSTHQHSSQVITPSAMTPEVSAGSSWSDRVTVEQLAYALLIVLAVVVRLIDLGARPLAPAEAETALRAWQASQGLAPTLDAGIALLFSLETATFFLFGAHDALVRFWPYAASVGLIFVLYDWRRWFNRPAVLLAATLLTFSPLVNAFGRRGDGAALVVFALALALAGWWRVRASEDSGWTLLAIGAALIFIGGPAAPSALLALALVMILSRRGQNLPRPHLSHLIIFTSVLLVLGTAFFSQIGGLGLAAQNWSQWLSSFTFSPKGWLWGLIRLALDEPLVIPLGIVAAVRLRKRSGALRALAFASLVMMLIAIMQGPYAVHTRSIITLLAALPAASAIIYLIKRLDFSQVETTLYAVVVFVMIILGGLALTGYASSSDTNNLILLGSALAVALLLTIVFGFFIGFRPILLAAASVLIGVLALLNFATAWGMAYDVSPPRFAALYQTDTRSGVYDLVATAVDISERSSRGEQWALPVALISGSSSDDVLHWYLRQALAFDVAQSAGLETAPPLVVAPAARQLPLTERFAGQDFAIFDAWDPADAPLRDQIEWALFRNAPWIIPTENEVLWADTSVFTLE
ncbi:MAG: glycosyltransferase family 39 protein [Caldilineales bacterium]|nr:glycosyltransferase family 39 protein [Caldilineales bacterium]